jgi:hypothetical protein
MAVYYLYDDALRQKLNKAGENFWYLYITEIFNRLGVSARPLDGRELLRSELDQNDTIFTGAFGVSDIEAEALEAAMKHGCTLVAFATHGCDSLFGIRRDGEYRQPDGDFGLSGYFKLGSDYISELLPIPDGGIPLPVFSGITRTSLNGAAEAGAVTLPDGGCTAGLIKYKTGKSTAYYFAFDLPKTLWTSSAGKPVNGGSVNFPVGRIPDSRITPLSYDTTVAFGDYYIYILQSILVKNSEPMIHRLPPYNGIIPDYLVYIGGDDDAASGEMDLEASQIMHAKNLPYHMNLMQDDNGEFVISREQYNLIKSRGHELALHYNFIGGGFTQSGFKEQFDKYVEVFGEKPICEVGHCLTQEGWAERCRYQEALGVLGDNGKSGEIDPNDINAFNMHGYAFGTAYPFFARDDHAHGNRQMKFLELPVSYYEPRLTDGDAAGAEKLHSCADRSAYFGRTLNLFLHPHYVTGRYNNTPPGMPNPALRAVDEILDYSANKSYNVILYGPDKLCLWWHERAESYVKLVDSNIDRRLYKAECRCADGIAIKIPLNINDEIPCVSVDGVKTDCIIKIVDGRRWMMIILNTGKHEIELKQRL